MKKKGFLLLFGSILLALTLVMLPVMAGCGEVAPKEGEKAKEEVEEKVELKEVKIIRQDNYGAVETQVLHNEKFAQIFEEIANKYGYTFKWEYYWNNALYSPEAACEAVGMGGITTASPTDYILAPLDNRLYMTNLAFLFAHGGHLKQFTETSPIFDDIRVSLLKQGVVMPHFRPGD